MANLQKRRCFNFTMNHFVSKLDATCNKITQLYEQSSTAATTESINYIERLAHAYIRKKKEQQDLALHPQNASSLHNGIQKKKLIDTNHVQCKSEQKQSQMNSKKNLSLHYKSAQKKGNVKLKQNLERISEELERININEKNSGQENSSEGEQENVNKIQSKSLSQMISLSLQKRKEKKEDRQSNYNQSSSDSSQYQMTDYSSNESSNQNFHDEVYQFQSQPLFGIGMGIGMRAGQDSQAFKTQSQPSHLVFKQAGLINSPKKSKGERKRVYMNNKRIPRWAQSREEIAAVAQKQSHNPKFEARRIYGMCIVEQLNTNVIFGTKDEIIRNSSAKWSKILKTD